ncbi:hypothetical protein CHX27_05165 [Flavobacterium aurantiibacter]|uniref:Uncharacterized protein n=1 Tax=Flavobacterium aurantiibacter TaxID=2023067 RepID=A0A255ZX24_9FLAO|nr:hypothetical protein [Flavobacterium sp.]OYQ46058.1 hypothetical protein CHX27_05165 [Flavobacterium aurantiibacter]
MFTTGQLIFAALFVVCFTIVMVVMYRKDLALHKMYYRGNYKILLGFFAFIAILFLFKFYMKH